MEVVGRRRVRSGKEYDSFFPKPDGKDIVIKEYADVKDTIQFIQRIVPLTLSDTARIAKHLKGKSASETCSNFWHFVYDHIPYSRDKTGVEQIRRPARTWWDRNHADEDGKVGGDCDCFTVFLSSMLMNARIPHKYRITKYPKYNGETPYWQHIYIVVPKDGKLDYDLKKREDYIVLDCVKDNYDDEEPYLEKKDYNMRLDYLNGLDGGDEFEVPKSADAQDLAAVYDEEDLGKIGQWLKKAVKNVGKAAGKVGTAVAKTAGKVVKVVAKVGLSPLRNGLLLAMKANLLKVASKLRFAYLSDDQARKLKMNPASLAALRKVRSKVESIYEGAGGSRSALQAAILSGNGNRDRKVPLSGLNGLGVVYADQEEYNILHNVNGLGEIGQLGNPAFIAAAMGALKVIAMSLNKIKGLFPSGSAEAAETDTPVDTETAPSESDYTLPISMDDNSNSSALKLSSDYSSNVNPIINSSALPAVSNKLVRSPAPGIVASAQSGSTTEVAANSKDQAKDTKDESKWKKPLIIAGVAATVAAGAYLLLRKRSSSNGLNGLPGRRKKKQKKTKRTRIKSIRIR